MGKIFSRQHIELFFLFFPETRIGHFMQIVSIRDNLLEMSNPVFLKIRKISPICCLLNYPRVVKVTSDKKGIKIHVFFFLFLHENVPAPVAQLDARPTGDQKVAGSTPAEVGNILSWRLIMKYFLRLFSSFR